jgi:hypothetical protein
MKKVSFVSKFFVCSLVVCLALALAACSITSVVQKAQSDLQLFQAGLTNAVNLVPTLNQVNPDLGAVVTKLNATAGPLAASALAACATYLAKPSGDNYQNLLNLTDSIVQTVDAQTLAAGHVTNQQSQTQTLATLTVIDLGAHALLSYLESKATAKQIEAVPTPAATTAANFQSVKDLVNRGAVNRNFVEAELAKSVGQREAETIMVTAGL